MGQKAHGSWGNLSEPVSRGWWCTAPGVAVKDPERDIWEVPGSLGTLEMGIAPVGTVSSPQKPERGSLCAAGA